MSKRVETLGIKYDDAATFWTRAKQLKTSWDNKPITNIAAKNAYFQDDVQKIIPYISVQEMLYNKKYTGRQMLYHKMLCWKILYGGNSVKIDVVRQMP